MAGEVRWRAATARSWLSCSAFPGLARRRLSSWGHSIHQTYLRPVGSTLAFRANAGSSDCGGTSVFPPHVTVKKSTSRRTLRHSWTAATLLPRPRPSRRNDARLEHGQRASHAWNVKGMNRPPTCNRESAICPRCTSCAGLAPSHVTSPTGISSPCLQCLRRTLGPAAYRPDRRGRQARFRTGRCASS